MGIDRRGGRTSRTLPESSEKPCGNSKEYNLILGEPWNRLLRHCVKRIVGGKSELACIYAPAAYWRLSISHDSGNPVITDGSWLILMESHHWRHMIGHSAKLAKDGHSTDGNLQRSLLAIAPQTYVLAWSFRPDTWLLSSDMRPEASHMPMHWLDHLTHGRHEYSQPLMTDDSHRNSHKGLSAKLSISLWHPTYHGPTSALIKPCANPCKWGIPCNSNPSARWSGCSRTWWFWLHGRCALPCHWRASICCKWFSLSVYPTCDLPFCRYQKHWQHHMTLFHQSPPRFARRHRSRYRRYVVQQLRGIRHVFTFFKAASPAARPPASRRVSTHAFIICSPWLMNVSAPWGNGHR